MDLVICRDYGPFMLECDPKGGHITWLENPGRVNLKTQGHWKERYIGRWPAMHRLAAGHFTQKSILEIVAASVVRGPHDKTTPIPVLLFQAPEKVLEATEWQRDVIDDESFTCIHCVHRRQLDGPDGLDSLILGTREGITILSYDSREKSWKKNHVSIGEPQEARQTADSESPGSGDHWGTSNCDIGRVGNDAFAYIATLEPFHGIKACVYTKVEQTLNREPKWQRQVLDTYGTPNQLLKYGDGPGHYVLCADFDGDGDDEFLLSLFGPLDRDEDGESLPPPPGPHPFKGIMYYKAIDLSKGIFAKWRITEESSARIALGNFAGTGRIDLASISYNVSRYYEEADPVVTLHLNKFASSKVQDVSKPAILSTLWDDEGMVYLLDPSIKKNEVTTPSVARLLEIADYAISIEVWPPGHEFNIAEGTGFKLLFGSVSLLEDDGSVAEIRQPFSIPEFTAATTTTTLKTGITDDKLGAVLLRFEPLGGASKRRSEGFPTAGDVPVNTTLPLLPPLSKLPDLEFQKVENLWWGAPFEGVDFYNLSGFHLQFLSPDSSPASPGSDAPLAHLQFWTAARDVNCGVHNHAQDIFCEVHVALSPGTGNGGMARLKEEYAEEYPPSEYNGLGREAFDWLPLGRLDEHGGIWDRDSNGKPVRNDHSGTVKYPWHKWQGGNEADDVDVWMAIEFNPDIVDRAVDAGQKAKKLPVKSDRVSYVII
ncbi:hypothetical protein F4804DRAFT_325172 [Jackrogersella minutella]|nr:hypothetical protein F4804DRAFT_325172 [Jackrogersella minutella]